jgi:hypothetical protein
MQDCAHAGPVTFPVHENETALVGVTWNVNVEPFKFYLVVLTALAAAAVLGGCADAHGMAIPTSQTSTPYASPPPGAATIGPPFPTNANGMTYGSGLSPGRGPDLVAAYGTHGQLGYVRRADLNGPKPTALVTTGTIEEPHAIPLYAQDGVTRIGWFRVRRGASGEASN